LGYGKSKYVKLKTNKMGQYFKIVNVKKRQYLNPHMFGDGLKFMEFAPSGGGTMAALAALLSDGNGRGGGDLNSENDIVGSWAGDPVVITGDYADTGKFLPADKQDTNLYKVAEDEGTDISAKVLDALLEDKWFADDFIKDWNSHQFRSSNDYYKEVNAVVKKWSEIWNGKKAVPAQNWDVYGSKGTLYKITEVDKANDEWTCTCPAFTYAKVPGTHCKHIKEIIQKV
jgi:hypothetical protein